MTNLREDSPAALCGIFKRGQQIITLNGQNLDHALKKTVLDLMKQADRLTVEVQYNPDGFSQYDNGEELSRIKALAATTLSIDDMAVTDEDVRCLCIL